MPKGVPNKRYTPEFKKQVIETMQKEKLSYSEMQDDLKSTTINKSWRGNEYISKREKTDSGLSVEDEAAQVDLGNYPRKWKKICLQKCSVYGQRMTT